MRGRALIAVMLGVLVWMSDAIQAQVLTYTLSGPLKDGTGPSANSCRGDTDGDCLHNGREDELAAKLNPRIYYDESEECASGFFTPRLYYQVRPGGPSGAGAGQVKQWSAGDLGDEHFISVTYFILYSYDCGSACPEWAGCGHQGDSESVRYFLRSSDLVNWSLIIAEYNHHSTASGEYLVNGQLLQQMSFESHPIVAADEDSHGSWPGKSRSSSDCAADMSGCKFGSLGGACDCFDRGSMSSSTGYFVPLQGNIGGPPPNERFNASVLTVAPTGEVSNTLDADGPGPKLPYTEYWHKNPPTMQKFCGWQCPPDRRDSEGNCLLSTCGPFGHCRKHCSGGLQGKTAKHGFGLADYFRPLSVTAPATSLTPPWYICQFGDVVGGSNQPARGSASVRFLNNGENATHWFYNVNNHTSAGFRSIQAARLRYIGQRVGIFGLDLSPTNVYRYETMSGTSVAIGCELWVRNDGKHLYFWNCTNNVWQDCLQDETAPIPNYP